MFKKLFDSVQNRLQGGSAPTHPLASPKGIADVVGGIALHDPSHALIEIGEWLAGLDLALPEIGAAAALDALVALDECAHSSDLELLQRYLKPGTREHQTEFSWATLEAHAGRVFKAAKLVLDGLAAAPTTDADKQRYALLGARVLRAWSRRKKLLALRYRPIPDAMWQEAHEVVRLLARHALIQIRLRLYPDEGETTPLREYLIGVYLDLAPQGNLVPAQLEFVDRYLLSTETYDFAAAPTAATTHAIDFAQGKGPYRSGPDSATGPSVRFLGAVRHRGTLMKLASQVKRKESVPEWVKQTPLEPGELDTAILALLMYWAPAPPKRNSQRKSDAGKLLAVFGFDLARRMVAASQYARSGKSGTYSGVDFDKLFVENRFGTLAAEHDEKAKEVAEAQKIDPHEVLRRMESRGDKAQMEPWTLLDRSDTGFGVTVPTILPRHRIGSLVAVREEAGLEWRLGVIRRIGRDANKRPSLGIESLPGLSICAAAKSVDQIGRWIDLANAGGGWIDALLVDQEGTHIVLPAGAYLDGVEAQLRTETGIQRIRLKKQLEDGPDFDRAEFERVAPAGAEEK